MGFWKGAVGTKKQKIFWVVFSIIVALAILVAIFFMLPKRVVHELTLYGGEWAHFYPDSFWHGSATFKFATNPKDGFKTVEWVGGASHVYNMKLHGVYLDYDMKADYISLALGNSTMSNVFPNWNRTITVTDGSAVTVTLDDPISNPLDFIISKDVYTLETFLKGRNDLVDKDKCYEFIEATKQLSSTAEISSDSKYVATQRIGVGIKVNENNKIVPVKGKIFTSIARVNLANSTNFTGNAEFELSARQLLQLDAPDNCTSDSSYSCRVVVRLEPRYHLFFGIVVVPLCLAGTLLVIGLMAIKAFHVRQVIASMRKKATEEGVALEEGKSKDIHQERMDEANAEGDMSETRNSSDEPLEDNEEDKEEKKSSEEPAPADGSAVLN